MKCTSKMFKPRKNSTQKFFVLSGLLFLMIFAPTFLDGQTLDLTGAWQSEFGTTHLVRQIGNKIYWFMDNRPTVQNVFVGAVTGNTITGEWADLPGWQMQGSGILTLRIESNDRIVKISESANYRGSIWTRQGGSLGGMPDLSGTWYAFGDRSKPCSISQSGNVLTFTDEFGRRSAGSFLDATSIVATDWEGGLRATIDGNRLVWPRGGYWTRGPAVPPGGSGICDDPRTQSIMDEWLARAIPPQKPGESLRYESWGRLVGRTLTNVITAPYPPDTHLTRCEYLWQHASQLRSTNLGTLKEYVEQRRR